MEGRKMKKMFVDMVRGFNLRMVGALAMLALVIVMPACGGGGPTGSTPVPTPGPTPTPTVWVLQGNLTRTLNPATGTFGSSYVTAPPEMKVRRMIVKWGQLPTGVTVMGRFINNQDAIQSCYNANFVCSAIVVPTEDVRDANSQTVTVQIQTGNIFVWVVATGGESGGQTPVPVTVELYSSL